MEPKPHYPEYQFEDSAAFVATFDELPLWSAPFGLLLLKHLPIRRGMQIVDLGSGAGFPLLELASRYGDSCKLNGADPWQHAQARAAEKVRNYGLRNVELLPQSGASLPFEDGSIDLIVSNLGINNFEDTAQVFRECLRVLRPGGSLALSTNLEGHWRLFYELWEQLLQKAGMGTATGGTSGAGTSQHDSQHQRAMQCGRALRKQVRD